MSDAPGVALKLSNCASVGSELVMLLVGIGHAKKICLRHLANEDMKKWNSKIFTVIFLINSKNCVQSTIFGNDD